MLPVVASVQGRFLFDLGYVIDEGMEDTLSGPRSRQLDAKIHFSSTFFTPLYPSVSTNSPPHTATILLSTHARNNVLHQFPQLPLHLL
jgi:hypothetical protein